MNFVKQSPTYNFKPETVIKDTDILYNPTFYEEQNEFSLCSVLMQTKEQPQKAVNNFERLNPFYNNNKTQSKVNPTQKQAVQTLTNVLSGLTTFSGGLSCFNKLVKNQTVKQTLSNHTAQVFALTEIGKGLIKKLANNPNLNPQFSLKQLPNNLTDLITVAVFTSGEIAKLNNLVNITEINKQLNNMQSVLQNGIITLLNLKTN